MKWPFGVTYEGEFSKGVLTNNGKLIGKNGEQYEGNFKNNYFNGKGKYTFNEGSKYKGYFKLGLRNGRGIYMKKDEFTYTGNWVDDYPHGLGTFTFGNISVEGIWKKGINVEITKLEGCEMNEFNHQILNFKIPSINLLPQKLPNLISMNIY